MCEIGRRRRSNMHSITTHAPAPTTPSPSLHLVGSRTVVHPPQNHGSLSWKYLNVLYQARIWPRYETTSSHRPNIKVPRIPCTPDQLEYERSLHFGSSANLLSTFQFSNFPTSSSFPFSLTSPQIRVSLVIVHGSGSRIEWRSAITIIGGCGFYDC